MEFLMWLRIWFLGMDKQELGFIVATVDIIIIHRQLS